MFGQRRSKQTQEPQQLVSNILVASSNGHIITAPHNTHQLRSPPCPGAGADADADD